MKRIGPPLEPEWTRIKWTGPESIRVWQPRVKDIVDAWDKVEKARNACIVNLAADEMDGYPDRHIVMISKVPDLNRYSACPEKYTGGPFKYKVAIVKDSRDLPWWKDAILHNDNKLIGNLLGYPDCCIDFFLKYWVDEKFVDTTWPMVYDPQNIGPRELEVESKFGCNILLRWLGIRLVSHLPCSFVCEDTIKIAEKNAGTFKELGHEQELSWLLQMLSWPMEWSALHGIAEIKTPILTISTRTDMTGDKYIVRHKSDTYPLEGARGRTFPYR